MYQTVLILVVLLAQCLCHGMQCDEHTSVDISGGNHLPNGDIYFDGARYTPSEYYVEEKSGRRIERGCVCAKKQCIMKCCPPKQVFSLNTKKCSNISQPIDAPDWMVEGQKLSNVFKVVYPGNLKCRSSKIRVGQAADDYNILPSGELYVEMNNNVPPWIKKNSSQYCIDTFVTNNSDGELSTHLDALICFDPNEQDHYNYTMSSTCMLVSCVFILATVAVYACLPELRNLHGRVLMAYLLCLFIAFLFMASMQIQLTTQSISSQTCVTLSFLIYFFLESAFFWLNVMCFDIWWTFSGKRGMSLEKMSIRARFGAYALYAFGIPTALTVLLISLEFSGLPPHPLLPMLKQNGCFLYGNHKLLYLYGPIVILCAANLIFFLMTALKINQIKRQTSVLKSKESSTHDQHRNDEQRLLLYVKLFTVMGINWIMEVVSALYPEADYIWKFIDAYNVLIGVIIFIIFVCKKKTFRLIKKRYKQLRGVPMSRTQTTITSTRTVSSRDENMLMDTIKNKK